MPILQIRGLPQKNPVRIQQALKKATAAIAAAYGCPPNQVWATWQEIRAGWYVEGATAAMQQTAGTHPPIAELICFEGKPQDVIEKTLAAAAQAISEGLGLGKNVFVGYQELKSGQVIAGDGILRKSA
jgi:hypothetical protein